MRRFGLGLLIFIAAHAILNIYGLTLGGSDGYAAVFVVGLAIDAVVAASVSFALYDDRERDD